MGVTSMVPFLRIPIMFGGLCPFPAAQPHQQDPEVAHGIGVTGVGGFFIPKAGHLRFPLVRSGG